MRGFCFVFPECSEILGGLFLLTYLLIFLWAVLLLLLAHRRHLRLRLSLCSIDLTSVRVPGLDTGTILVVGSFSVQRTLLRILLILGTLTGALDEFCLILFKKKKKHDSNWILSLFLDTFTQFCRLLCFSPPLLTARWDGSGRCWLVSYFLHIRGGQNEMLFTFARPL